MKALKELDFSKLLERQEMLDDRFKAKMGIDKLDERLINIAYLDEVGEFLHELKPLWGYWKKEKKPIDKQRVLEELSDCFHFYLSFILASQSNNFCDSLAYLRYKHNEKMSYVNDCSIYVLLKAFEKITDYIMVLEFTLEELGYTLEEFLEVHHQVWLRNMNIRTGEEY